MEYVQQFILVVLFYWAVGARKEVERKDGMVVFETFYHTGCGMPE